MDLTPLFQTTDDGVRLVGSRCIDCGHVDFPRRLVCAECFGRHPEEHELTGAGRVRCATRVTSPPSGFDGPLRVAVIDLAEGPAVFGIVGDDAPAGAPVRAQAAPVKDGAPGFVFRRAHV
jgi:uncharacterized OB-fold protein